MYVMTRKLYTSNKSRTLTIRNSVVLRYTKIDLNLTFQEFAKFDMKPLILLNVLEIQYSVY